MNEKLRSLLNRIMIFAVFITMLACDKDDETPVLEPIVGEITVTGVGFTKTFSVVAKNIVSYLWDFGDGTGTSTDASPTYEYEASGDYTVKVTVTGAQGSTPVTVEKKVPVTFVLTVAEISNFLSGESTKTWVISTIDGIGPIADASQSITPNDLTIATPFTEDDVLTDSGLGAELGDEFTFSSDGSYSIDRKDGYSLSPLQEPELIHGFGISMEDILIATSSIPNFYFGQVDLDALLAVTDYDLTLTGASFSISMEEVVIPDVETAGGVPTEFFDPLTFPGNPATRHASLVVEGPNPDFVMGGSQPETIPSYFGIFASGTPNIIKTITADKLVMVYAYDTDDADTPLATTPGHYDFDNYITITFVPKQ